MKMLKLMSLALVLGGMAQTGYGLTMKQQKENRLKYVLQNKKLPGMETDLSSMKLEGKDFSDANLTGANFAFSDLAGADFMNADLTDVNFSGVKLYSKDLKGAKFLGAHYIDDTDGVSKPVTKAWLKTRAGDDDEAIKNLDKVIGVND